LDDKVIHLKNRSDIPRLLKAMDVFVFPSLYEGLPLSIVESQVAGIRTVVSDRINGECFFNEDLIVKRLNEPPKVWVDAILDTRIKNFYNNDITIFDMNKVIRSLENVYSEKKDKILIIGKIHHNTYALVRSFGEAGMHVDLILYGCHDSYIGCSVYIHQLWYCDDTEAALYRVKELVSDEACRYIIISATDAMASLMDLHYDELKGHCHFFNAGDTGLLTHYMDKIIQARLAEKVGFAVPLTTSFRKGDTLSSSIFPCLVKPQASIDGGKRVAVCYSQKELDACAGRFADVGHILVQQYIEEGVEVAISGLAIGGKVVIPGYVIKKRKIKGGTTYSCTAPISQLDEKVVASSEELVKAMNYEGLFGIECIKSKGRYWFIEINLRSPATFYSLAVAGANLPLLYYQYYAESRPLAFDGTFREISSMVELKDFNFVKHRKVGLLKWLRQRRSAECRYFHSKTDKRACRRAYREYVIETVMNLLRKSLQLQIHSKEYKK